MAQRWSLSPPSSFLVEFRAAAFFLPIFLTIHFLCVTERANRNKTRIIPVFLSGISIMLQKIASFFSQAAYTEAEVLALLRQVQDPYLKQDWVSSKIVRQIKVCGHEITLDLVFPYPMSSQTEAYRHEATLALQGLAQVGKITLNCRHEIVPHLVARQVKLLQGVKNVIAVASGKGGVGKSTTTVNLALALAREGARVGILDADIYGPSVPLLLGLQGENPVSPDGENLLPLMAHGVQSMSIGYLVDVDQPMVWRGPMVTQALHQLLRDTRWDDLDYLFIDMPPGTGDIQLSLSQQVPLTGAIIVTTPQDLALLDARKGLKMFEKVNVPILGVVENMSVHVCSQCGHQEPIFGSGGGEKMAQDYGVNLLGKLPLEWEIRAQADAGKPTVVAAPDSASAQAYAHIARQMAANIAQMAVDYRHKFPSIVIQKT